MNDALFIICEVGIGLIAIPWCVWVTAQIYGLRQHIALQKQMVDVVRDGLERIEQHLSHSSR